MVLKLLAELVKVKRVRYRSYYPLESCEVYFIDERFFSIDYD